MGKTYNQDIAVLTWKNTWHLEAGWLDEISSQYEIDLAKIKIKIKQNKVYEIWNIISQYVPVKYFRKKGYLTENISSNISIIQEIYSVESILMG